MKQKRMNIVYQENGIEGGCRCRGGEDMRIIYMVGP